MSSYNEYKYFLHSSVNCEVMLLITYIDMMPLISENLTFSEQSLQNDVELFPVQNLLQNVGTTTELRNSMMSELFITAQLFADQEPMHPMPISTKTPSKCSETSVYWNEWLTLPVKFRDLPRNTVLALTIWGVGEVPVGGTTISLFHNSGMMKDGIQCLHIWPNAVADTSYETTTPAEFDTLATNDPAIKESLQMESFRLDKLREKYERREIPRNEWMDRITNRRIARVRRSSECPAPREDLPSFCKIREFATMWIELPFFGFPVLYEEEAYMLRNGFGVDFMKKELLASQNGPQQFAMNPTNSHLTSSSPSAHQPSINTNNSPTVLAESTQTSRFVVTDGSYESQYGPPLIAVWDPDLNEDNPVERKYRKLARDILRGSIDPNLKPNREEKFAIDALLANPSDALKNDEKDLLWKFRYTLTDNKRAIVKFLLSVDWLDEDEVKIANELLHQWCEIDIADALKLLGRQKEFKKDFVREFAVSTLNRANNDDLLDFLLQLVQAIRYENTTNDANGTGNPASSSATANSSHTTHSIAAGAAGGSDGGISATSLGPLARFLIHRSCQNFKMANYFYWYLKVELEDCNDGEMYQNVLTTMLSEMQTRSKLSKAIYEMLLTQEEYIHKIAHIHLRAREEKGRKDQKEEKLRTFLKQLPWPKNTTMRLPLDPSILVTGVVPQSAKMFKSAMYPCVIDFTTTNATTGYDELLEQDAQGSNNDNSILRNSFLSNNMSMSTRLTTTLLPTALRPGGHSSNNDNNTNGNAYKVMIKNGDDLRQDQLIMQMIILMDRLLKKVNLDLKLTPYRILATSTSAGLMGFVLDSYAVGHIISSHKSPPILSFLRQNNPDPNGYEGVSIEAINTYVKSLAGYCVMTYILGIGDRHLDNLMMKKNGNLFHIDFGFVFGADPKPYPPPFKLTKEMVEGMGGVDSEYYTRFKTYCCQAYNWLRKSSALILNLLNLMVDAGIAGFLNDPTTTLQKVQEKFRLDLTDEQAEHFFLDLINDSVNALVPVILDLIHKVATDLR